MTARVAEELPHNTDGKFGEILGFLDGDGTIGFDDNALSIFNAEMFCIRKILDNFESVFRIERERFCYYLTVSNSCDEKKIQTKWREYLGIKKKIIIYKNERVKKKNGQMRAALYDKNARTIVKKKLDGIKSRKERNPEILIGYLRGFYAAEGAVIPGKIRKVIPNSIQFPQKGRETPDTIKKILDKLGVESRVVLKQKKADYYCVNITGYNNFKQFYELGLADLHPEKKEKVRKGLDSYDKVVSRKLVNPVKLLRGLDKKPMTRNQIYSFMNSYPQKINGILYSKTSYLVKNKLISKERSSDGAIHWKITSEGRKFLHTQE